MNSSSQCCCKGYFDENISRFEVRLFKPFTTERMSVS